MDLGKMPPNAVEIEEAVLGAVLLEKDSFLTVSELLTHEDFYKPSHQLIFNAITQLHSDGSVIDTMTVMQQLKKNSQLDSVGGAYALSMLTNNVASAAHIEFHAAIIKEKSIARKLIWFGSELQKRSYDESQGIDTTIEFSRNELFKILEILTRKGSTDWRSILSDGVKTIYDNIKIRKSGRTTGIPTGIQDLDDYTGGWQKTNLIILGGRPGCGKTSTALFFLRKALEHGIKCMCFSLEMANVQLCHKLIGTTGVSPAKMRSGHVYDEDINKIENYIGQIEDWPLVINDDASISISQIETEIEKEVLKKGLEFVVIDYLQLITNPHGSNENERFANTSRRLKQLAKRCNIPLLVLSQLNRDASGKIPSISQLRGSGAIEQDADDILFVYREWDTVSQVYVDTDDLDIIFAKHRMGNVGTLNLKRNKTFTEIYSDKEETKPF